MNVACCYSNVPIAPGVAQLQPRFLCTMATRWGSCTQHVVSQTPADIAPHPEAKISLFKELPARMPLHRRKTMFRHFRPCSQQLRHRYSSLVDSEKGSEEGWKSVRACAVLHLPVLQTSTRRHLSGRAPLPAPWAPRPGPSTGPTSGGAARHPKPLGDRRQPPAPPTARTPATRSRPWTPPRPTRPC